ncbi:hypothetical protein F4804DRAFT_332933 [Jackrogersella minutella]|nr:hypothetical protein F4804DRAFT_332933 [Jackrogersella minutella]
MTTVSFLPAPQHFQRHLPGLGPTFPKQRDLPGQDASHQQAFRSGRVSRATRISKTHVNRIVRQRKPRSSYPAWGNDDEDGRRLAADPTVVLPSDRRPKKPRLERQEAFREPVQLYHSDAVDDDSELYKLGLLYDDEHTRGSQFSLDTIVHSEPVFSIRPAKRPRKQRRDTSYLHLDLSFASLGSDSDIQHYLAPELALLTPPADDAAATPQEHHKSNATAARAYRDAAALSTIPELPESSDHSFDPSAPAATDYPDLTADVETDEEEDAQDWALLEDADVLSTTDGDAPVEDAASTTGEAWIVLGDGS